MIFLILYTLDRGTWHCMYLNTTIDAIYQTLLDTDLPHRGLQLQRPNLFRSHSSDWHFCHWGGCSVWHTLPRLGRCMLVGSASTSVCRNPRLVLRTLQFVPKHTKAETLYRSHLMAQTRSQTKHETCDRLPNFLIFQTNIEKCVASKHKLKF